MKRRGFAKDAEWATARTALACACGAWIVGAGFTDSTSPASTGGTFLCAGCAADANRERPGSVVQAFVIVDFDQAAREVAGLLALTTDNNPRP